MDSIQGAIQEKATGCIWLVGFRSPSGSSGTECHCNTPVVRGHFTCRLRRQESETGGQAAAHKAMHVEQGSPTASAASAGVPSRRPGQTAPSLPPGSTATGVAGARPAPCTACAAGACGTAPPPACAQPAARRGAPSARSAAAPRPPAATQPRGWCGRPPCRKGNSQVPAPAPAPTSLRLCAWDQLAQRDTSQTDCSGQLLRLIGCALPASNMQASLPLLPSQARHCTTCAIPQASESTVQLLTSPTWCAPQAAPPPPRVAVQTALCTRRTRWGWVHRPASSPGSVRGSASYCQRSCRAAGARRQGGLCQQRRGRCGRRGRLQRAWVRGRSRGERASRHAKLTGEQDCWLSFLGRSLPPDPWGSCWAGNTHSRPAAVCNGN